MKTLLLLAVLIISQNALSDCAVFISVKEFNVAGYPIRFDFTKMLSDKGYEEIDRAEDAHFLLSVEAEEIPGRFVKAHTSMRLIDLNQKEVAAASKTITCFTMSCAVSDFAKSFNRTYQDLSKRLTNCR